MTYRLKIFIFIPLFFLSGGAFAQSWQIITPRQVLPVPSDGSTVNFPKVNLIVGMKYRVHATGSVSVSTGSDIADACYYWNIIPFPPAGGLVNVPVSMKVRSSPSNEDWFYNAAGQPGYQSSHDYQASILSLGDSLSFRFFDRADPPSSYYSDNTGSILIDVARETPGIAIEKDTINFGTISFGTSKTVPDSIEGYGIEGYKVDNAVMMGKSASSFTVFSQHTIPFVLTETTNEFLFKYIPSGNGPDTAEFHIFSSNGFGADKEKIIYLFGNGIKTQLSVSPDTLDFGLILTGTKKTLTAVINNLNNFKVSVVSVLPSTAGSPYSVTGVPVDISPQDKSPVLVTFAPTADGIYFEKFNITTGDSSVFNFYAKGSSGKPLVFVDSDHLDFGKVVLYQSKTLQLTFGNAGTGPLKVSTTAFYDAIPFDYSVDAGSTGATIYEPGHYEVYSFTFHPQTHIPFCGNHDGHFTFNFDDGTSKTIFFMGCDHAPLEIKLTIDSLYYVTPGSEIDVIQKLINTTDPLDSALNPVRTLTERITYDPTIFDLVSVNKTGIISGNQWTLSTTNSPGAVDVAITTTTSQFSSGGHLLQLRFRAHPNAQVGQFTNLEQTNISFSSPFEPFALTQPGRITISGICTPVNLATNVQVTSIEQNNPNPFNPSTHIKFTVGKPVSGTALPVRINLYDALGRFVKTLLDEDKAAGIYNILFDGSPYPSGAYTYVFQAGDYIERKKMILVK